MEGGAVLQVLCALRILCGSFAGCAEDTELAKRQGVHPWGYQDLLF